MLALLLASVLSCHAVPSFAFAPTACTATARPGDDKPLKALDAWLKLYRSGKMNMRAKNISKDSIAMKFGIAPKDPNWLGDLEGILEAVAKIDDAEAAVALVEVAAIGIDPTVKYGTEMLPLDVRAAGERWAARLTSAPAKEALAKAARGEIKVEKARMAAMRTAGVKCLGKLKDAAFRPVLEQALGDSDDKVRVNAAEALKELGDEAAAMPLVAVLERDTADVVLIAAAQALVSLYEKYMPKAGSPIAPAKDKPVDPPSGKGGEAPAGEPKAGDKPAEPAPAAPAPPAPLPQAAPAPTGLPESVRLAVRAANRALGRTTWRADLALLGLLDKFRSLETVPALIAQLEYFFAHLDEVKSGKLSGLAVYQAHELLVSMTGAVFPADQPEKWRAFWEAEKDKIAVTEKRDPAAAGAPTTVAGGFCGIPVQGTRVVFVVDLSRSMTWPMQDDGPDGKKKKMFRIDFAKRELKRAMDLISPNAQFNLITFNGNPKADAWKPTMVQATPQNREAFKKYVDGLDADGGTNLWSGLEDALKIRSAVFGNRYTTNIDELFVLSDGAPTVGDVQDPIEILRLVQECNKFATVRINTIFISSETPPEERVNERKMNITAQELMRRMAQDNGGKFREL